MLQKIRNKLNKKGFTLVELIVVLVILAILAALLIPALTGYIDKANKEKIVAETRMVVMAAQTELSQRYGKNDEAFSGMGATSTSTCNEALLSEIKTLAEVQGTITSVTYNGKGTVVEVKYGTCTYTAASGSNPVDYLL